MYYDCARTTTELVSTIGTVVEKFLNFADSLLKTSLMPKALKMSEAKILARKECHLYSTRELIRWHEDDIVWTLNLSKKISKVANTIGIVLFDADVASTWYTNYKSGSETWITNSLADTLIDVAIFAIGFIHGRVSLRLAGIKYLI